MARTRSADLDAEIGQLYALPLGEFTPARNALAVRLRKDGDQESSARVKGLAKPSVSAWVVNVLFVQERRRMEALLAAGERARRALGEALTRGAAETLRSALQEERTLRDELRLHAVDLLKETGAAAGREIVDRITVNLESLALSPAGAESARRGWLDGDLEPPGFEILAGLQLGAGHPDRRGLRLAPPPAPERKGKASREEAVREEREEAERQRREQAAAKARERIARAEEEVARAAGESARLHSEAQRAERDVADAQRAADLARARAEKAAEQLAQAQARLKDLSG